MADEFPTTSNSQVGGAGGLDTSARLRMAPVDITPGDEVASYYVAQDPETDRYLRLPPGAVEILKLFDGRRTTVDVAEQIGNGASTEQVEAVVSKFTEHNLLVSANGRTTQTSKHEAKRPHDLSLIAWNPDAWLHRHQTALRMVVSRPAYILGAALIFLGVVVGAGNVNRVQTALAQLPSGWVLGSLLVALLGCVVLHEAAHVVTLKAYGGSVTRVGFKLYYLMPGMFSDTSALWRLRLRRQRVAVVSAGILFHLVVAGAATVAFGFSVSSEEAGQVGQTAVWLAWFILANIVFAVSNAIPFIKLDGYWVVVTMLDVPNLRVDALGWVKALLVTVCYGEPLPAKRPRRPILLAAFGLADALFVPFTLVLALFAYRA